MSRSIRLGAAALVAAVLLAGCTEKTTNNNSPDKMGPPPGPGSMGPKGPAKDGKEVFQTRGCVNCHSAGETGGKKGKGPDLSHVAADPAHTKEWLIAYVQDPQAANPNSRMPKFTGKIDNKELDMLGDYLAGLK